MKALFITTANIYDKQGNGGVKASAEHLKMIQKYFGEENVKVCVFVQAEDAQDIKDSVDRNVVNIIPKLNGNLRLAFAACFGCRLYMPWEERKLFSYIDDVNPDLLFLDFSILGRIIKRKAKYKTIVFFHNIEADYTYNKVKNESYVYLPAYIAAKKNDKWATLADEVMCFNERDSRRLAELYGRNVDLNIPITFHDCFDENRTTNEYKKELLFLGSLFGPNQEGIEWFIKNVMPQLEGITLNIVGKGFETKKEEYERYHNVNVIGSVDDPAEYYYKHSAVVMPIRYGAGMKVKTAEAMMYGRYIFASAEALEGYKVAGVEGIKCCNTVEEYAKEIIRYFDYYDKKNYEIDVRKLFLEKYETEAVYTVFAEELRKMLDGNDKKSEKKRRDSI